MWCPLSTVRLHTSQIVEANEFKETKRRKRGSVKVVAAGKIVDNDNVDQHFPTISNNFTVVKYFKVMPC